MSRHGSMAGTGEVGRCTALYGRAMQRSAAGTRFLVQAAALARIDELGGRMASPETADTAEDPKATARAMWALGDYHRFAKQTVWDIGPVLVAACGVGPGQRVLDVAAGSGNVALRAAAAGADVVASDITPENLEAGRREASALGLDLEWVEADAEALPFDDTSFEVVTSSFGAMFAPDHQNVADELVRVCKPGGTIGMANFVPDGVAGEFFTLFGKHAPPPPAGALPPVLWGDEKHVRELFGDRVESLELRRTSYVEHSPGDVGDYVAFFQETFGPLVALRGLLAGEPDRLAALDEDFRAFAERANSGSPDAAEYEYGYLLVIARRRM
jgi:SAM-dependent methyltransferase